MNLARVIGTIWATAKTPELEGMTFRLIQPVNEKGQDVGEPLVAADRVASVEGDRVYFVRAREAAKAIPGKFAPLDAAILGLVDGLEQDA